MSHKLVDATSRGVKTPWPYYVAKDINGYPYAYTAACLTREAAEAALRLNALSDEKVDLPSPRIGPIAKPPPGT